MLRLATSMRLPRSTPFRSCSSRSINRSQFGRPESPEVPAHRFRGEHCSDTGTGESRRTDHAGNFELVVTDLPREGPERRARPRCGLMYALRTDQLMRCPRGGCRIAPFLSPSEFVGSVEHAAMPASTAPSSEFPPTGACSVPSIPSVGEKYITAVLRGRSPAAGRSPRWDANWPPRGSWPESMACCSRAVRRTSNRARYGGDPSRPGTLHDPERDATTLRADPAAIAAGVPVLGVCRGFQEMNVAFGGTLWQVRERGPASTCITRTPASRSTSSTGRRTP